MESSLTDRERALLKHYNDEFERRGIARSSMAHCVYLHQMSEQLRARPDFGEHARGLLSIEVKRVCAAGGAGARSASSSAAPSATAATTDDAPAADSPKLDLDPGTELANPPLKDLLDVRALAKKWRLRDATFFDSWLASGWLSKATMRGVYVRNLYVTLLSESVRAELARDVKERRVIDPIVELAAVLDRIAANLVKINAEWARLVSDAGLPEEVVLSQVREQNRVLSDWVSVLGRLSEEARRIAGTRY